MQDGPESDEFSLPPAQNICGGRIGQYRILRSLGVGGMGEVYLAERADEHFEQRVAIKIVRGGVLTRGVPGQTAFTMRLDAFSVVGHDDQVFNCVSLLFYWVCGHVYCPFFFLPFSFRRTKSSSDSLELRRLLRAVGLRKGRWPFHYKHPAVMNSDE